MASRQRGTTSRMALGGILTAVSVSLLYFAAISPTGRLGLTAVAGLCPVIAVLYSGRSTGYLVWGATSVLGMMLVSDKAVALSYATLFGLYPVLKSNFEGTKSRVISWVCKLLYGTVGVVFLQKVLIRLLMQQSPHWMDRQLVPLSVMGVGVFILYDIGLSRLIGFISKRLGRG